MLSGMRGFNDRWVSVGLLSRLYLLCRVEFIAQRLRHPKRGMSTGPSSFFYLAVHGTRFLHGSPPQNDLVSYTDLVGRLNTLRARAHTHTHTHISKLY